MIARKALLIGLDSAPLSLLLPWMARGYLPNLKKIFDAGSYGNLFSNIPVTPVAWSTIYTGKNPGKHGVIGFKNLEPGTYREHPVSGAERDAASLWDIVGRHGGKVVVVSAPLTYPPRPVNGYLVCGFMAPGTKYDFTYPSSLKEDLKTIVPEYRIGSVPSPLKGIYLKELKSNIGMTADIACALMKRAEWDLAVVVFKETDEVQHSFFTEPGYMLSIYKAADEAAGRLLDLAGKDTSVFVVSDHGGELLEKRFNVAEFLQRKNYVRLLPAGARLSTSFLRAAARVVYKSHLNVAMAAPGISRASENLLQQIIRRRSTGEDEGFYSGRIDWANTSVFISSGVGVRVNLKGREPSGSVEPSDYERVRRAVAKDLTEVRDPETGKTAFRYALPREEVLSGHHLDEAPDIVCLPTTGILPTEASSFDPLTTTSRGSLFSAEKRFSGTHSPDGLMAMSGPLMKKGIFEGASLIDVAPTILYSMGLPVPEDMDGHVVTAAFSEEIISSNPVSFEVASSVQAGTVSELSDEESRIVEERLKKLGYLS